MRIAIDLRPLQGGKTSGVEVYIRNMLAAIFKQDSANEYVLWTNAFKPVGEMGLPSLPTNVKRKHTRIPNLLLNLCMSVLRWPKADRLAGRGIEVLWVPDPRPAPVSSGCRKVTTFHDLSFEDFRYSFTFKTRLWHRLLRPRREARESDRIVAVSEFTKGQLMSEYGIPTEKITVIPEAGDHVKPLNLPKGFELLQRKYKLPETYFLCLSTLEPRKNIAGVIQAFRDWQAATQAPVDLVMAGTSHPSIFARVPQARHPRIHWIGFVDEADKPLLFEHCLAFLYPSFYEGFGLPILEAMQCGAPVVTSDATGTAETAGDAALLVNPNDLCSLKEALHRLYRDDRYREELRRRGFKRAGIFSWPEAASQLAAVICPVQ